MAPPAAMAAAAPGGAANGDSEVGKLQLLKDMLYDRVTATSRPEDHFSQEDLLDLGVIPNGDKLLLLRVVQELSNDKLLVTMKDSAGAVFWKWREVNEAKKYRGLTDEQVMVYSFIDESGGDGVWSQTILRRLNMHDSVLKKALQALQTKNLIAPFKNVEHPNKKMYIKASIQPSDRATGGPWYTDQDLDEGFIESLQKVIFNYIKAQGSYNSRRGGSSGGSQQERTQAPTKGVLKGGLTDKRKKRSASELEEPPAKGAKTSSASVPPRHHQPVLLPLPAGYTDYPTVRDVARFLSMNNITNNTILSEHDVQKLVDVLMWDNLVEPVRIAGKIGYRVARIARQATGSWPSRDDPTGREGEPEPHISAYTELPCGRCPVFELCEEGGPVGPSNCEYFKKWLADEDESR